MFSRHYSICQTISDCKIAVTVDRSIMTREKSLPPWQQGGSCGRNIAHAAAAPAAVPRLPPAALSASLVCPGYQQPRAPLGLQRIYLQLWLRDFWKIADSQGFITLESDVFMILIFNELCRNSSDKIQESKYHSILFLAQYFIERKQLFLRIKRYCSCQSNLI